MENIDATSPVPKDTLCFWIDSLLHGQMRIISYDEIYFSAFESVRAGTSVQYQKMIEKEFESSLYKYYTSIDSPNSLQAMISFFENLTKGIASISNVFQPFSLIKSSRNLTDVLYDSCQKILFSKGVSSNVQIFIHQFIHNLPGTKDLESQLPILNNFKNVFHSNNSNLKLWKSLMEMLEEATIGFLFQAISNFISIQKTSNDLNPIPFFGYAQALLNHERLLWKHLPDDDAFHLEFVSRSFISDSVSRNENYLFYPQCKQVLVDTFIKKFSNFQIFKGIIDNLLNTELARDKLKNLIFETYDNEIQTLIQSIDPTKLSNQTSSTELIKKMINIYNRFDFILTNLFQKDFDKERQHTLIYVMVRDQKINFANCAANAIGRSIQNMIFNSQKVSDEKYHILDIMKILNFSDSKEEFIKAHNNLMLERLCQNAGIQYKIENEVLDLIEPALPPSLSDQFNDRKKVFEISWKLNDEWNRQKNKTLHVFIVDPSKIHGIAATFKTIILPTQLKRQLEQFETFFLQKKPKTKVEWVFEDNTTVLKLTFNGRSITLTSPLFFALFIYKLAEKKRATVGQIAIEIGLLEGDGEILAKKGVTKIFPLFLVQQAQPYSNSIITFNPNFIPDKPKYAIVLPSRYKINMLHKTVTEGEKFAQKKNLIMKLVQESLANRPFGNHAKFEDIEKYVRTKLSASYVLKDGELNEILNDMIRLNMIKTNQIGRTVKYSNP